MKAKQKIIIHTTKSGERISFESNNPPKEYKTLTFKVGDTVPDKYINNLLVFNPDLLDITYISGIPQLTATEKKKFEYVAPISKVPKEMKIFKRKYSQEKLTSIWNKDGRKAIIEIAKEFKFKTKYVRTSKLINQILAKQEADRV